MQRARKRVRGRPPARPRRKPSRLRLLEAAARVFAEHGYEKSTVDDVVAAAGLSKGTFYWNFPSKEELLFSLLDEWIDRPLREVIGLLKAAPIEVDMAGVASEAFGASVRRRRQTALLAGEYWLLAAREPRLRARYARRQAELREALADALEARAESLGAPEFGTPADEVATAFLALMQGLTLTSLVDPTAVPDHLLGQTIGLVYAGLVSQAEDS